VKRSVFLSSARCCGFKIFFFFFSHWVGSGVSRHPEHVCQSRVIFFRWVVPAEPKFRCRRAKCTVLDGSQPPITKGALPCYVTAGVTFSRTMCSVELQCRHIVWSQPLPNAGLSTGCPQFQGHRAKYGSFYGSQHDQNVPVSRVTSLQSKPGHKSQVRKFLRVSTWPKRSSFEGCGFTKQTRPQEPSTVVFTGLNMTKTLQFQGLLVYKAKVHRARSVEQNEANGVNYFAKRSLYNF